MNKNTEAALNCDAKLGQVKIVCVPVTFLDALQRDGHVRLLDVSIVANEREAIQDFFVWALLSRAMHRAEVTKAM